MLAVCLLIAPLSLAHAVLVKSVPTAIGLVTGPEFNVELRFNSRIVSARSRLSLVPPDQTVSTLLLSPSPTPASLTPHLTRMMESRPRPARG
jgi:methionine-rich copper-binding protein CopC